eukprot:Sdes_comp19184_c0_seq2m9994
MNIFRIIGDLCHVVAIFLLLWKIWKTRSVAGISFKSQALFCGVFYCRYLDLFTHFVSVYNSLMKMIYIVSSSVTVYFIFRKFRTTYDKTHDVLRVEFLLIPCLILGLLFNYSFEPIQILWSFSIFLESVAILPQLFMIQKTGEAETITSHYLFALGAYRGFYLFNWIYRYFYEDYFDQIAVVCGVVQTVLYCDFFYLYITKVLKGKKFKLPA